MLRVGGTRLTVVRVWVQGKHTAIHNARRTAMPQEHVVSIDPSKPLGEEPETGHNRWHEAIEPVVVVDPGDTVIYETRDAFDGQLNRESTAEDVGNLDLSGVHPLTGPVFVRGAEPGDLLEVKLTAVEADPWEQWGCTATSTLSPSSSLVCASGATRTLVSSGSLPALSCASAPHRGRAR